MSVFCAALWLALNSVQGGPAAIHVDWSAAVGADSDVAATRRELVRALNERDPAVESFYLADAIGIMPDRSAASLTLFPRKFESGSQLASETGTYIETRSAGGGADVEGLYVTVYARGTDNRWRIALEVWTTGSLRRR
jgi:hypothetical protein